MPMYIRIFILVFFLQNRRLTALPSDLMASSMTREAWVNSSTDEGTQDSSSMSQSIADTTFIVESMYAHKYMYTVRTWMALYSLMWIHVRISSHKTCCLRDCRVCFIA